MLNFVSPDLESEDKNRGIVSCEKFELFLFDNHQIKMLLNYISG
jgi:hypothetical protein